MEPMRGVTELRVFFMVKLVCADFEPYVVFGGFGVSRLSSNDGSGGLKTPSAAEISARLHSVNAFFQQHRAFNQKWGPPPGEIPARFPRPPPSSLGNESCPAPTAAVQHADRADEQQAEGARLGHRGPSAKASRFAATTTAGAGGRDAGEDDRRTHPDGQRTERLAHGATAQLSCRSANGIRRRHRRDAGAERAVHVEATVADRERAVVLVRAVQIMNRRADLGKGRALAVAGEGGIGVVRSHAQ